MKINNLKISGFLSYQEEVEIDFTQFDLACITGSNGAGKSSILDAITFSIFGKARQSNESLINLQSDEAVVGISFEYSGETYTINRSNARGKPGRLTLKTPEVDLTERTTRDTQSKIEQILKINYETFVHAVFFLQGDSDQFVSAPAGQRKQALFKILGLDAWEEYRLTTAAEIKTIEQKMERSQGAMAQIEESLTGREEKEIELRNAQAEIETLKASAEAAKKNLDAQQKIFDEFQEWAVTYNELELGLDVAKGKQAQLVSRAVEVRLSKLSYGNVIDRKYQIDIDYARSQELTGQIAGMREEELSYNKISKELSVLKVQADSIEEDINNIPDLEKSIAELERKSGIATELECEIEKTKSLITENRIELEKNKSKRSDTIIQIQELEGHDNCPLCEQGLENPETLILKLQAREKELRDTVARNEKAIRDISQPVVKENTLSPAVYVEMIARANSEIENIKAKNEAFDYKMIDFFQSQIDGLFYNPLVIAELQKELDTLQNAPKDYGILETAEKAIGDVEKQLTDLETDTAAVVEEIQQLEIKIASKNDEMGDRDLHEIRNNVGDLNLIYNGAQEKVLVTTKKIGTIEQSLKWMDEQKERFRVMKEQGKENIHIHQQYSTLHEAFSKKGVPALLVEQSLPQIESKANELLYKLSDGKMTVHFVTQKAYSDSSRDDMKETLDIEIQDQSGIREYEMYSGGESFRINFAIRMALSNVLANRAGAKLRTLVIDEGFGSQDASGRDKLINAINLIKDDYDKVLVISHIQAVIDAFPVQLKVEKTAQGSQVRVL